MSNEHLSDISIVPFRDRLSAEDGKLVPPSKDEALGKKLVDEELEALRSGKVEQTKFSKYFRVDRFFLLPPISIDSLHLSFISCSRR